MSGPLTKLEVKNFQGHKDTRLEFHPGVNVIVGLSDAGKSTIIRALRWIVWSRPQGDAFRSHWGGDTVVTIEAGPHTITRMKGSENIYVLDGTKFKAIGTEVPEEIKRALNVTEINLQQQFDRPFLLDISPGAVAEHFNRIARLDAIDRGLKNVQKWLRELEQNKSATETQLVVLNKNLIVYADIEQMEIDISALEKLELKENEIQSDILRLDAVSISLEETNTKIAGLQQIVGMGKQVNSVLLLFKEKADLAERINIVAGLLDALTTIDVEFIKYERLLQLESHVLATIKLSQYKGVLASRIKDLVGLINNINQAGSELQASEKSWINLEREFKEKFPKVCPLCGCKGECRHD